MKLLAGLIGGFILAVLGSLLVAVTFAASSSGGYGGFVAFFVFGIAGLAIALTAPAAAKAWRRLLITAGILSFMLPLAGILYTGSYVATKTQGNAEAAGALIGGGLVSGALGFVGLFLGVVFLVIGLLVGRDKQVVYIERPSK